MTPYSTIARVPEGSPRPFWSVMIPTWNPNLQYLQEALTAVLGQDPGADEMEIAVIDDSSDAVDPRECIRGAGETRIKWFRQERRVGIARNWNTCIQRAHGRWVHILHQDDLLRPGFYDRLRAGIDTQPTAGAAFCRDTVIDAKGERLLSQKLIRPTAGILADWVEHLFVRLHLRASALVVRRDVNESIGGFSLDLPYALDWDMWKRIAAAYPMWYEPRELACCRRHASCASVELARSGASIADIRKSIELAERWLEPAIAADVSRRARISYTGYAVNSACGAFLSGDVASGLAQIREARRLTSTSAVAWTMGRALRAHLKARWSHRLPA
jgi:hypothetical protein